MAPLSRKCEKTKWIKSVSDLDLVVGEKCLSDDDEYLPM